MIIGFIALLGFTDFAQSNTVYHKSVATVTTAPLINSATPFEIPKGTNITVDGKINSEEWQDALSQDLKNGGNIKFKHDGEFEFDAFQAGKLGLAHVYLRNKKDNNYIFYVLHSSASLGMAVYQEAGLIANLLQKFGWELKDHATNAKASSEYLKTNGWLANVSAPPSAEKKYKISIKFRDGEVFQLAAVYVGNPMSPQYFPTTLADDTLKMELLFGGNPANLSLKNEQWATLKLK